MYLPTRFPQLFLLCVLAWTLFLEGVSSAPLGSILPRGVETLVRESPSGAGDSVSELTGDQTDPAEAVSVSWDAMDRNLVDPNSTDLLLRLARSAHDNVDRLPLHFPENTSLLDDYSNFPANVSQEEVSAIVNHLFRLIPNKMAVRGNETAHAGDLNMTLADALSALETALVHTNESKFTLDDGRVVYRDSFLDNCSHADKPVAECRQDSIVGFTNFSFVSPNDTETYEVPAGNGIAAFDSGPALSENTTPFPTEVYPGVTEDARGREEEGSVSDGPTTDVAHAVTSLESQTNLYFELSVSKGVTQGIPAVDNVATRAVNKDDGLDNGTTPTANKDDDLDNDLTPAFNKDDDLGNGLTPASNKDDDLGNGLTPTFNKDDDLGNSLTPATNKDDTLDHASTPAFNKDDSLGNASTPHINKDEGLNNASTSHINKDESLNNASTRPVNKGDSLDNALTPFNKDDSWCNASTGAFNNDYFDGGSTPVVNIDDLGDTSTTAVIKDDSLDNSPTPAFNKDDFDGASTPAVTKDDDLDNSSTCAVNTGDDAEIALISLQDIDTGITSKAKRQGKIPVRRSLYEPVSTEANSASSTDEGVSTSQPQETPLIAHRSQTKHPKNIGILTGQSRQDDNEAVPMTTTENNTLVPSEGETSDGKDKTSDGTNASTAHFFFTTSPTLAEKVNTEAFVGNDVPTARGVNTTTTATESLVTERCAEGDAYEIENEVSFLLTGHDLNRHGKDSGSTEDAESAEASGGEASEAESDGGKGKRELEKGGGGNSISELETNLLEHGISDEIISFDEIVSNDDNKTELWQIDELIKKMLSEVMMSEQDTNPWGEQSDQTGHGADDRTRAIGGNEEETVHKEPEFGPDKGKSIGNLNTGDLSMFSTEVSATPVPDAKVSGILSRIELPPREGELDREIKTLDFKDNDAQLSRHSTETYERVKKRETNVNRTDDLRNATSSNASSSNDSKANTMTNANAYGMSVSASSVVSKMASLPTPVADEDEIVHLEQNGAVSTMNETVVNRTRLSLTNIVNRTMQLLTNIGLINPGDSINETSIDELISSLTNSTRWVTSDVDLDLSRETLDTVDRFRGDFEALLAIYDEKANVTAEAREKRASESVEAVSNDTNGADNSTGAESVYTGKYGVGSEKRVAEQQLEFDDKTIWSDFSTEPGNKTKASLGKSDVSDHRPFESTEAEGEIMATSKDESRKSMIESVESTTGHDVPHHLPEYENYLSLETLPKTGVKSNESLPLEDWQRFSNRLFANRNADEEYLLYDLSSDSVPIWFTGDGRPVAMPVREGPHQQLNLPSPDGTMRPSAPAPPEGNKKPRETPPEQKYAEGDGSNADANYLLTVTLPSFLGLLIFVILCCICMRASSMCCRIFEADVGHGRGTLIEDDAHSHSPTLTQYTGRSRRSMV